jgi:hypothetical protein
MRPQLIIDCGGRVLTALLVTAEGLVVPCSQEIRQIATRHVSAAILFEPRIVEDRDFIWEDALEALSKATAQNFFQRARRIGLRRPWDPQASAEALQLASPLSVLSSASALADRTVGAVLPGVGFALLDALLEPAFSFLAGRQLAAGEVDPILVLPAQTGRKARLVLEKLFRHRGFRRLTLVPREIAAAMALVAEAPCAGVVLETAENDLHLHRVEIDGDARGPRFRTAASITLPDFGRSHWIARIAEALRTTPSAAFDRSLTSLLTGSPESLPSRVTHGALQSVLDDAWIAAHDMAEHLRAPLAKLAAEGLPVMFAGEIFLLDAVRRLFDARSLAAPLLDHTVRSVALAMQSPCVIAHGGSLRVNAFHGETVELLSHAQLPASGEACLIETDFRLASNGAATGPFLIQLLWGTDRAAEGNATLCAMPLELRGHDQLRLTLHLRRNRDGHRLHGTLEARMPRDVVVARTRFTEELEVLR